MPKPCYVFDCKNTVGKGKGLHFYQIPSEERRRVAWIVAINRRNWSPPEFSYICSDHFISGKCACYTITVLCTFGLMLVGEKSDDPCHPDYVPTIFEYPRRIGQNDKGNWRSMNLLEK